MGKKMGRNDASDGLRLRADERIGQCRTLTGFFGELPNLTRRGHTISASAGGPELFISKLVLTVILYEQKNGRANW